MTHKRDPSPATDFWFAQLDVRLTRIEAVVDRIERQVWSAVYIGVAILAIETLRILITL